MNDIKKVIGIRINGLLASHNVKQKELAAVLSVSDNVISYFTKGTRQPNIEQLIKLADFFDVSTDYLLGRTEVQSTDADIKAVCEYTGLDEMAIYTLQTLKEQASKTKIFYYINEFLSDEQEIMDFISLLHNVVWENVKREYLKCLINKKYNIQIENINYSEIFDFNNNISEDEAKEIYTLKLQHINKDAEDYERFKLSKFINKFLDDLIKYKGIDELLNIESEIKHYKKYIDLPNSLDRAKWEVEHFSNKLLK